MALEFKPSVPSISSMAGYGSNAVDLFKQASNGMNSGLDSIINVIRDTDDANAMRAMMAAYDENNPMSVNEAMPYIASTFRNARANTLEKLATVDRALLNEQLNKDNLYLAKRIMDQYQADINKAVANADVAGTKRANAAAIQATDANGNPIRTDAYTLGNVDPLLNSASQRAIQGAQVRKLEADARKEALEFNRNNGIDAIAYQTAKNTPATMWGTALGNQYNLNTAQAALAQYVAQNQGSGITEADIPAILAKTKAIQEGFAASGQDPLQLMTEDFNRLNVVNVDPTTGQITTNSMLYDPSQSAQARQFLASQQEATAQQQAAEQQAQQRARENRAFLSLVQQVGQGGSQALTTNEGRQQYNELNTNQRKVVDLMMQEQSLQQEIVQAQQEQQRLASAPYGYVDRQALDKASERVMSLAQQQKDLQTRIANAQTKLQEVNQVDEGQQLIQNAGFSKQDQAAFSSWLGAERQAHILRSSKAYNAMKAAVDPQGLAENTPEYMDAVFQATEAMLGLETGDLHPLIKLTDRDGKPFTPEEISNADYRDYAISLDKKYSDMDGDSNLSWKEPDEILEKLQQVATKVKSSLGSYKNLNISKKQYDDIVKNLAVVIVDASMRRNHLPGSLVYRWDYDPAIADQLAEGALAFINNNDPLLKEMYRTQIVQDKNAQTLFNAGKQVEANKAAAYANDLYLRNLEQNAKLVGLGDAALQGVGAAIFGQTRQAGIDQNVLQDAYNLYRQGR